MVMQPVEMSSKVSARLLAEVINEFFQPLSYKSMLFLVMIIVGIIAISEIVFKRTSFN